MKKYGKIITAILIVALVLIGLNPYSIFFYGGASSIYVGDAISVSGSRSSTELTNTCSVDAYHIFRIFKESQPNALAIPEVKKDVGKITQVNGRYMFGDGSGVSSYSYSATAGYPLLPDSYFAKEWIECNGAVITKDVQIYYFKIVSRPVTPTIIKVCGNLGENQKTRSCFYHTCETQANGNWDWSTEKQSSSFCDYVAPPTPPAQQPQSPSCVSVWITSAWSECVNSIQTRQVYDNAGCSWQTGTKPETQQSCTMPILPTITQPIADIITPPQVATHEGEVQMPINSTSTSFIDRYALYIALGIIGFFAWLAWIIPKLKQRRWI